MGSIPPGNHTGRDDEGFPYFVCPYCGDTERTLDTRDSEDTAKSLLSLHIAVHHKDKI